MRKLLPTIFFALTITALVSAQNKRLWVLNGTEVVEYDPATFVQKQTVKVPSEINASPQNLRVNRLGQMLFAAASSLPLSEDDVAGAAKVWLWDGHAVATLPRDVTRTTATTGSNLAITERSAVPFLDRDGKHIYWFANQARRLQREGMDLSTKTTWSAWTTDLSGGSRQEIASTPLPECSCPTGGCEESCPYAQFWAPDDGVGNFFLLTQIVAGKNIPVYGSTYLYQGGDPKWSDTPIDPPLKHPLDATAPDVILEAIPDTGCCGWVNASDDQAVLHLSGKTIIVFDERTAYKNSDYDVSFFTKNGKLAPGAQSVAFTVAATSAPNIPIQLSEQGQENPEESSRIRKALAELPAVEIKSISEAPKRIAFLPHAELVGWLGQNEVLIVEGHLLVAYNVVTNTRKKSTIHVEDASRVFLR